MLTLDGVAHFTFVVSCRQPFVVLSRWRNNLNPLLRSLRFLAIGTQLHPNFQLFKEPFI